MKGLLGYKRGMARIFDEKGLAVPVTVIEAGPCVVTQVKTHERDGYQAVQLGFGAVKPKRLTQAQRGHLEASGGQPLRHIKEFKLKGEPDVSLGDTLDVSVFAPGDRIQVTATSRGLGFAGTIKRHHFTMGDATHGNSLSHRSPGSIGQRQTPGRVFPGKKMSGHMGAETQTTQRLEVVKVDVERGLIAIKGSVPGAPGGDVIVRPAAKA